MWLPCLAHSRFNLAQVNSNNANIVKAVQAKDMITKFRDKEVEQLKKRLAGELQPGEMEFEHSVTTHAICVRNLSARSYLSLRSSLSLRSYLSFRSYLSLRRSHTIYRCLSTLDPF